MDATSGDATIQQQSNQRLRFCIEALQEMGTAWSWSFRARRAIQILASTWLTRGPRSPLWTSSDRTRSKIPLFTEFAADQTSCDASVKSQPAVDMTSLPPTSPAALSEFERQFGHTSVPELSADDLNWIFNADITTNGGLDDLKDVQYLTETDRWLTMAAEDTFTTTDMESHPVVPDV